MNSSSCVKNRSIETGKDLDNPQLLTSEGQCKFVNTSVNILDIGFRNKLCYATIECFDSLYHRLKLGKRSKYYFFDVFLPKMYNRHWNSIWYTVYGKLYTEKL